MSGDGESVQSGETDQGAEGSNDDFVTTHLNNVPEDYRPHVEPYLRQIESNANERFREHASYKEQWEPYEELGLTEYDPEGLQQLIQFAETMGNEEQFDAWLTEVATARGILGQESSDLDEGDEFGEDEDGLTPEAIAAVIQEVLDERLNPLQEKEQQREYQQQVEQADTQINELIEGLKAEHGEFDENAVYRFAYVLSDDNTTPEQAIQAGFQEYMQLRADIENETVTGKVNAPAPPESGVGPANTQAQAPDSFEDAKKMARERLAQMNS